jgi:hypothetical protein
LAATDYLKRLDAEGARIRMFDKANANLIDALVELGGAYWDTAGTITTLCAKGFDGLTVPLRDGMNVGTPVAFAASDLNVKTGLKGDGSSKYINSNRNNDADGQNDQSMGLFISQTITGNSIGTGLMGTTESPNSAILQGGIGNRRDFRSRNNSNFVYTNANWSDTSGYVGMSRSNSSGFDARIDGSTSSTTLTSSAPLAAKLGVFVRLDASANPAAGYLNGGLSAYHIGPALDLATLDGILTTFMSEVDAV